MFSRIVVDFYWFIGRWWRLKIYWDCEKNVGMLIVVEVDNFFWSRILYLFGIINDFLWKGDSVIGRSYLNEYLINWNLLGLFVFKNVVCYELWLFGRKSVWFICNNGWVRKLRVWWISGFWVIWLCVRNVGNWMFYYLIVFNFVIFNRSVWIVVRGFNNFWRS